MSKKNKISEQEVKKIAELSRLSLTSEELKKRTEDMNNILNYMDILNEIDTETNLSLEVISGVSEKDSEKLNELSENNKEQIDELVSILRKGIELATDDIKKEGLWSVS